MGKGFPVIGEAFMLHVSNPSTMLYKEAQEILQFPRVNVGSTTPWFVIRTLGGELGPVHVSQSWEGSLGTAMLLRSGDNMRERY